MSTHIVLGGSSASGRATRYSDLDYLVVSDDFPKSYFASLLGSDASRADIEFMDRVSFESALHAVCDFEPLLNGKPPTVSHSHLRFFCRMLLGKVVCADAAIDALLRSAKAKIQRATTVTISTHYFNLLEDVVSWALDGRCADVHVNAADLYQRACLVMASHRGIADPNVKWGWRSAHDVASALEKELLQGFFRILGASRLLLQRPMIVADYCDAVVGLGYIAMRSATYDGIVDDSSRQSTVFLRGIPDFRVGYDFESGMARVITNVGLEARFARGLRWVNEAANSPG